MSTDMVTPEVVWAQRSSTDDPEKNYVHVTISVPDVPKEKLKLDVKPTGLSFTGASSSKHTTYHVVMDLFAEIDPDNTKINHTDANVQLILRKKELKEEYWPRLLKDKAKAHYLRTDFDKWVDEDEQNEAPEDDYMNQFSGMGGSGGEDGGFGGIDFSKLGGMGGADGMPGMEGMAGGEEDEDDDDDDDDEMPELEEEEATKGKAKIEEVS